MHKNDKYFDLPKNATVKIVYFYFLIWFLTIEIDQYFVEILIVCILLDILDVAAKQSPYVDYTSY